MINFPILVVVASLKIWNSDNIWLCLCCHPPLFVIKRKSRSSVAKYLVPTPHKVNLTKEWQKWSKEFSVYMWKRIDWSVSHFNVNNIKSSYDVEKWKKRCFLWFKTVYQSSLTIDYSRKKQTGGLRRWNSQGYQRNSTWNFQGLIKNKVEFPRVTKKNNVEFPGVLVFGLGIPRDLTQFCRISRVGAFCLEFPGVKQENEKPRTIWRMLYLFFPCFNSSEGQGSCDSLAKTILWGLLFKIWCHVWPRKKKCWSF